MNGKILQHQRKHERCVLQIMDEERGHGLEGFEFLRAEEAFRELKIEERSGGLRTDAFQQVEIFAGKWNAADTIGERDKAKETAGCDKRNAHAISAFIEMIRIQVFEI